VGRILSFVRDAHFHVGMSTLIVKMGKISLFAWDAYFHRLDAHIYRENGLYLREYRHRGAYFYYKKKKSIKEM